MEGLCWERKLQWSNVLFAWGQVGEVVRVLPCKAGYYANQAFRLTILWQWIHVPSGRVRRGVILDLCF